MDVLLELILNKLNLSDFPEPCPGLTIWVWANAPAELLADVNVCALSWIASLRFPEAMGDLREKGAAPLAKWLSFIWSQDDDPATHWSEQAVSALMLSDSKTFSLLLGSTLAVLANYQKQHGNLDLPQLTEDQLIAKLPKYHRGVTWKPKRLI